MPFFPARRFRLTFLFMMTLLSILILCALMIRPEVRFDPAAPVMSADAGNASGEEKIVYLTFDDGPSAVTEDILDYLQRENIPATFFVIGMETERAETLLKRMQAEGHSIGLHSYTHNYCSIYESPEAFFADQQRLIDYLEPILGETPDFFRFPGGSCNATAEAGVLDGIRAEAEERDLRWFDWNSVAEDSGSSAAPADQMAENIISTGGDRNRIMGLMHDNSIRTTAVDCLRIIVPYYRERGYTFKAITETTRPIRFR